jgi:hypothetical protein
MTYEVIASMAWYSDNRDRSLAHCFLARAGARWETWRLTHGAEMHPMLPVEARKTSGNPPAVYRRPVVQGG